MDKTKVTINRKEMNKEHKITTVNDMVKCTNADNLKRFIADLEAFLSLVHSLPDIVRERSQWDFSWIDDKKRSIEISIEEENICDCPEHSYYEWEKEENKCYVCGKPIYYNN